jgi:hypothetical protein
MWFVPGIVVLPVSSVAYWWTRIRGPSKPSGTESSLTDGTAYYANETKRELELAVAVDSDFRFRVARERGFHRFFKAMGLAREWRAPCSRFRQDCYVVSDDPEVQSLLMEDELRDQFYGLLYPDSGSDDFVPTEVRVYPTFATLRCRKHWFRFNTDAEQEADRYVPRLRRLAEAIGARQARDPSRDRDWKRRPMYALASPAMPLLMVGAVLMMIDIYYASGPQLLRPWDLIGHIWPLLVLLLLVWIFLTCFVLGGSSRLPPALTEIVLVGGMGLAIAGPQLTAEYNHEFDRDPLETVVSPVLDREFDPGGHRTPDKYYLMVALRPQDRVEKLRVSSELYDRAARHEPVAVELGGGALGYRWVDDIRIGRES